MESPGAASQAHPAGKGLGVPNRGDTTGCILLPGAAVVAWSRSVTFATSREPVRLFPCCVAAQVKGQAPGLPSLLCWGETSCASFGLTHVEGDDIPPAYGACSSWEECGALTSRGQLLQTGEGGRCKLGRCKLGTMFCVWWECWRYPRGAPHHPLHLPASQSNREAERPPV